MPKRRTKDTTSGMKQVTIRWPEGDEDLRDAVYGRADEARQPASQWIRNLLRASLGLADRPAAPARPGPANARGSAP